MQSRAFRLDPGDFYPNVVGGYGSSVSGSAATVGGGHTNTASAYGAYVGGGEYNTASGQWAAVPGGEGNVASGTYATVAGGEGNIASGNYSFAAGRFAWATNDGAFVWGDGTSAVLGSTTSNQFNIRANGGVRFLTGGAGMTLDGQPVSTGAGANSITSTQLADDFNSLGKITGNQAALNANGLLVNGNYVQITGGNAANGAGPIQAYFGGDGGGSDVQIGSMNSKISNIGFWNSGAGDYMSLYCDSLNANGSGAFASSLTVGSDATLVGGVNLDSQNNNTTGALTPGLTFGLSTGEGISSKRSAGAEGWGLDFWTDFKKRMSIMQNGNVGINTTTPTETLEINGTCRLDDNYFFLRTGNDQNSGLAYRSTVRGVGIDGPVLYGNSGGALSTANSAFALRWDNNANVTLGGDVTLGGAMHVAGAGVGTHTAAFIHVTDSSNIYSDYTRIDNPLCDGNPNAILLVTPNQGEYTSTWGWFKDTYNVIYFDLNFAPGWLNKWGIADQNNADMPTGVHFNVLVIVP